MRPIPTAITGKIARLPLAAGLFLAYLRLRGRKGLLDARFFSRLLRKAAGRKRGAGTAPLISTVAVTSRCPLSCSHCSEGRDGNGDMPPEMLRRVLDDIVSLDCPVIALTGGEPLCRPDLPELLDRIPSDVTAMLYTSGVGLEERTALKLRRRGNLLVCFSLDHSDPAEHDRRRAYAGAHAAALRGLELLKGGRCETHVASVVTRDRLQGGELERFAGGLRGTGVSCLQFFQPRPVGRLSGCREACLDQEEEEQVSRIARSLNLDTSMPLVVAYPELEQARRLGCCGGYSRLYVDARGEVCPCDFAPLSFGSVKETPLPVLWERMHGFFSEPGSLCLVRDHPEVFAAARKGRNVAFPGLRGPERLRSPEPGLFRAHGESAYRLLAGNLTLAAAACELEEI